MKDKRGRVADSCPQSRLLVKADFSPPLLICSPSRVDGEVVEVSLVITAPDYGVGRVDGGTWEVTDVWLSSRLSASPGLGSRGPDGTLCVVL